MQEARVDTIVHGGELVTSSHVYQAAIAIKGEQIAAVGPEEMLPPADHYVDATGKYVLPGAIDCHMHLGNVDDYEAGTRAAAYAGLTTVIPFGVYNPAEQETLPQAITRLKEQVAREAVVDVALHFILANAPYILESLPVAFSMGVTSFKMFMTYKKAGSRMCSDDYIAKVMEIVAAHGGIVQLHCENGDVIDHLENKAMAEGRTRPGDFPATCPSWAEEEAINRAIRLGAMANCPTYVVHLSTEAGLERIKQAQGLGQRVWTETCPQYLLLNEGEMERLGPFAKIGPPLRPADGVNQGALWRGVQEGFVSAATTLRRLVRPRSRDGRTSSLGRKGGRSPSVRRQSRLWCLWSTAKV